MISTIRCYIPYSAKAMRILRKLSKKYGASWTVDAEEQITIKVKTKHYLAVKDELIPLFKQPYIW